MKRALLAIALLPGVIEAQRDTAGTPLRPVVVTAERAPSVIGSSTSSVSRISVDDLARTPRATIADALRRVPGFALVDFDGLGFDPQLMVRGFYGGGEAEYVVVLIDGRPLAQLQNGLVPWATLPPLSAVEAIEVVRGSASALYGDAAIGGVINIVTRTAANRTPLRLDLAGTSYGGWEANAGYVGRGDYRLWGGAERTDGYRSHAERSVWQLGADIPLMTVGHRFGVRGRAGVNRQSFDEPGALPGSLLEQDRQGSDPLFRFDHTNDTRYDVGVTAEGGRVRGSLDGEWRRTEAVRTLALAPGFGDTKERVTDNARVLGSLQFVTNALTIGADLAYSTIDSRYFAIAMGERPDYQNASGGRGDLAASGEGSRVNGALFAQYTLEAASRVRVSAGARFDWLDDDFRPRAPSEGGALTASHNAFSPKLGVNIHYMRADRNSGHVYFTASSSFKAPTIDQLFDQRPIPVPFPPFALTTSNSLLTPQRGINLEAGAYHTTLLSSFVYATLSLSAYQIDMREEVDFNVETLRYINIGKSQHRGVEAGIRLSHEGRGSVWANYTMQNPTFRIGEHAGNRLKAIPEHTVTAGATVSPVRSVDAGVLVTTTSGAFIDDANTIPLASFTRVDLHASWAVPSRALGGVRVFGEVRNLLDRKYNTTAFVDPAGTDEIYFYPAAGRVISAGVRRGW